MSKLAISTGLKSGNFIEARFGVPSKVNCKKNIIIIDNNTEKKISNFSLIDKCILQILKELGLMDWNRK